MILSVRRQTPNVKLVVFSEEPLWDTLWYYDWQKLHQTVTVQVNGTEHLLPYYFLNHATGAMYDFFRIPYFLTTDNVYLQRYCQLLVQALAKSPAELLSHWRTVTERYRFVAEKRTEDRWQRVHKDGHLLALSLFRTRLAECFFSRSDSGCYGKGWHNNDKRQRLPDWHFDKLHLLKDTSLVVSALENTTLYNYITEKPFDVIACDGIPVYWATPEHRIAEFIPLDCMINVANLCVAEAADKILNVEPTLSFAEQYQHTQNALLQRFSNVHYLVDERYLFAVRTYQCFQQLNEQ